MRKSRIHIVFNCIVFLTIVFADASAQDAHPAFKQYTVEDGLSSSEVYQVKQDSKGYIWFATGNGVSRFNGYEFENFSMSDGLPDNTVFEIFEDAAERIWFVPVSCKLSYYYKGKIYPFKYNDALQKRIKNPLKTSFCVNKDGTVFLGVSHDGIYEISGDGTINHHTDSLNFEVGLTVIQPDSLNFIYSNNSSRDLHTIRFDTGKLKGVMAVSESMTAIPANARVIRTKSNKVLISCFDKLIIINSLNDYKVEKFANRINWFYEDKDGDLWVGTYLGGACFIRSYNFNNKKTYLENITVDCILQDNEGGFWFATEGNAVYYSPSKYLLTYDKSAGLVDNRTTCLTSDHNDVYVGLQNGFVHKISPATKVISYDCNSKRERSNGISTIFYDNIKEQIWVAANLHAGFIKNEKFKNGNFAMKFNRMLIDEEKAYWFACPSGLAKIKNNKSESVVFNNNIKMKRVNAIVARKKNLFYLGAMDGLWSFKASDNLYEYIGEKDSLLRNRILDLAFTPDSLLVIATKGAGLLIYDQNRVYQINVAKGLCGDNVYRIAIDGPFIWAATNRGLNRISISPSKPFTYVISSCTTSDGLTSNEVNDVIKANGKIWVATNKGLSVFYPNHIVKTDVSLPLYINQVIINEKDTTLQNKYDLTYNQNNVKIRFIALGYKNAGKLQYRYKMLGLDTGWVATQNREIQFTTLPPNNYTFLLSVYNSNGEWSKDLVKMEFVISSPIWKKWWFVCISLLLFIYIIIMVFRYRIKKTQEEEEKNTALYRILMNLKLKALRAQMNPHFTFNVMNSIQHFIINKDEELANRYLSKFAKLIRIILNNSEKNTVPVSEELKALELYLELESMRFEERFEYEIVIDKSIDETKVEIPSMLIQPYVENSVKHGILPLGGKGKIRIEIQKQGALLKCIIEDNGIGRLKAGEMNRDHEHKSFGTSITQERLAVINELYNSTLSKKVIDLYDENGNASGTRVEIYIPIN